MKWFLIVPICFIIGGIIGWLFLPSQNQCFKRIHFIDGVIVKEEDGATMSSIPNGFININGISYSPSQIIKITTECYVSKKK